MRVLVTRPERQAVETATKLRALGHEPVLLPLSRPVHDATAMLAALRQPHDGLIMTSAEAPRVLDPAQWLPFLGDPVHAVGKATADAARAVGFSDIATGTGTGADLASRIIVGKAPQAEPLLYLAGSPRSADLEGALREACISLLVAECYSMVPIDHDVAALRAICGPALPETVLLYSAEAARNFFALTAFRALPDLLQGVRIICLGPRIAEAAPATHRETAIIAPSPEEDRLLSLI